MGKKCIYKSEGFCAKSTSEHHMSPVHNDICDGCIDHQSVVTVSDRAKLQNLTTKVKNLLNILSDDPNDYADMGSFRQVKSAMEKIQKLL